MVVLWFRKREFGAYAEPVVCNFVCVIHLCTFCDGKISEKQKIMRDAHKMVKVVKIL